MLLAYKILADWKIMAIFAKELSLRRIMDSDTAQMSESVIFFTI